MAGGECPGGGDPEGDTKTAIHNHAILHELVLLYSAKFANPNVLMRWDSGGDSR